MSLIEDKLYGKYCGPLPQKPSILEEEEVYKLFGENKRLRTEISALKEQIRRLLWQENNQ